MVKHVLIENCVVKEIIPDINPIFPGVPIEERYAPDFVSQLIHVPDDTPVEQNWLYDPETGEFSEPAAEVPPPEPAEEGAPSSSPVISEASSADNLPADTSA